MTYRLENVVRDSLSSQSLGIPARILEQTKSIQHHEQLYLSPNRARRALACDVALASDAVI
jgi:hypothetical protein